MVRNLRHSFVHCLRHCSFQAGTVLGLTQTERWHASVHASMGDTPQTVTQVLGV